MMKYRYSVYILVFLLTLSVLADVAAQSKDEVAIEVTLDRDTIGMDEQATLVVDVSGESQNLPEPNLPTLPMFEVYSQGRSTSVQIVNGAINSSSSYRYILIPTKPGTYPIDQVYLIYNNRRYKGNQVELTVLSSGSTVSPHLSDRAQTDSGQTKDYFFEASVDKKKPFVNEQVTLTLKFFVAVQTYGNPELTEPSTTGFWAEVLGNKPYYYQKINNRNYKVIERKYALFPTQTGELTIGRAMIQLTVASKNRRRNYDLFGNFFGQGEDVTVRTNPIKLEVQPLPIKGKPSDFTGSIGQFELSASPNKREVEVNSSVTVTVKITGTGNIKSVGEPILPDVEEKFRIRHAASSENISKINDKISGTKIYEKVYVPKYPGENEIPPIRFNYFDPHKEKYVELTTKPIKLKVTKPEGYIASNDVPYSSPDLTLGAEARDIRFIKEDSGDLNPFGQLIIFDPIYLAVNGVPVLLLAGMIFVRIRREKMAGNIGLARSRTASKEARKRLSKAKSIAEIEKAEEFYLEIYTALTSYIADKMNISPHGLTTEKIKELLQKHKTSEETIVRFLKIMKKCDFARFAPSSITQEDINLVLKETEDTMVQISEVKFV